MRPSSEELRTLPADIRFVVANNYLHCAHGCLFSECTFHQADPTGEEKLFTFPHRPPLPPAPPSSELPPMRQELGEREMTLYRLVYIDQSYEIFTWPVSWRYFDYLDWGEGVKCSKTHFVNHLLLNHRIPPDRRR